MSDLGQNQTKLINRGTELWDFLPSWSPDGKTILFSETTGAQALGWLMVFDYEHRQTAQPVYLRRGSYGNHGSFSPDGLWAVYENRDILHYEIINFHIVITQIGGGTQPVDLPYVAPDSMDFDPVWRPTGSP